MGTLGYDDPQRVISFLNSPVGEQGETHLDVFRDSESLGDLFLRTDPSNHFWSLLGRWCQCHENWHWLGHYHGPVPEHPLLSLPCFMLQ